MPGRNANIAVSIKGEAEFDAARADAKRAIEAIEAAGRGIELSPELDTTEIRKAIDLAQQLDGLTAEMTVETDISEIVQAEALARSLRGFQARVDLSVDGEQELRDALNLSEQMERLRTVRLEVQGRQDLERAAEIADDLERRRSVPIDAQASDLVRLDDQIGDAITSGGEAGAEGLAGALADVDYGSIGESAADQIAEGLAAAGPYAAAAGAVGAIFGDEFMAGFNDALPAARADAIRQLKFNLTDSEVGVIGETAGELYGSGVAQGISQSELRDSAAIVKKELGGVGDDFDLTEVTKEALLLSDVLGTDLPEVIGLAGSLVKRNLVESSSEGLNLLLDLAQRTGLEFGEMAELVDEFGPSIKALGIGGTQGFEMMAEIVERRLTPQLDQAGEIFEELNENITTGNAAETLEQIGFNAEEMTNRILRGGPDAGKAVAEIATAILAIPDPAQRAAAASATFGGNMDLMSQQARDATLEIFTTADAVTGTSHALTDAVPEIEETASGLDRLKRVASDLGSELGGTVADGIDTLNSLAELDFSSAAESGERFGRALGEKIAGPVGLLAGPLDELGDKVGLDLPNAFDLLDGKIEGVAESVEPAVAGAEALSTSAREGGPALQEMADGAGDLADGAGELSDGLDDAAQSADELEAQLRGMFDFSADQLMRDIAESADELAASLKDGGAKAVEMSGDIDITSDAGRKLQEQLEGVNGVLIDAEVAYANQQISAAQLSDVHLSLRTQLENAGRAAGLTKDQIQVLTDKYLAVPDSVTTELRAIDNATAVVRNLQTELSKLKDKTITVTTRNAIIAATAASTQARERARGGWTEGLTLVGEEGPELIDVKGRAFVHNATATRDIVAGWDDIAGASPSAGQGRGRAFIENATFIVDRGMDLWQQADLAEQVYGFR